MRRCADQEIDPVGIPTLSYILGLGPMLPILAAGVGALTFEDPLRSVAIVGGTSWAATLLIFIAGVRRGYGLPELRGRAGPRSLERWRFSASVSLLRSFS